MAKRTMRVEAINAAIEGILAEFPGVLGWYAKNPTAGEELGLRTDSIMPTASAIKVGIMAERYRRIESREINPARRLTLTHGDRVEGTGVLKDLVPGLGPTITDLCHLMTVVGDDAATRLLVRLPGKDRINQSFAERGLTAKTPIWEEGSDDPRRYAVSSARDLAHLMESIATGGIASDVSSSGSRSHVFSPDLPW